MQQTEDSVSSEELIATASVVPSADILEAITEVSFRLPNLETVKTDISGLDSLYIRDLKKRLNGLGVSIPSYKMKFIYQNRVIQDRELIGDVCFKPGDLVYVALSLITTDMFTPKFDDFILSSTPKHLSVNVPVNVELCITLRANIFNQAIFTNALLADCELKSLCSGNMVHNLNNDMHLAQSKGYQKWIQDLEPRAKVLLLRVDEELDLRLENIRYNVDGVNTGYNKGDDDSWQRYTRSMPVPCSVLVSNFFDPLPHVVRIYPREALQPNTQYAILLQNNVPVRPTILPHYSIDFFSESTGDDKIIMFKTEKVRGKSGFIKSSERDRRRNALL